VRQWTHPICQRSIASTAISVSITAITIGLRSNHSTVDNAGIGRDLDGA
jgi:hypothetical protein